MESLFNSVQKGKFRQFIQLLSRDASLINSPDEHGQTLLHVACAFGQLEIVLYLLQRHDCDFKVQEEVCGHTPLHVACLYEQQRIVQELLKLTISNPDFVNQKDKLGWSALHHAARNGNLDICKLLVSSGADPALLNKLGKTPCHYAVEHGHEPVLAYLYDYVVSKIKPPVQDKTEWETPTLLHCAAFDGQTNTAAWLKEKSFPPAVKCRRVLDLEEQRGLCEYPDEVANSRGHHTLKTNVLLPYRTQFQEWIDDIARNKSTLDRIKLCICGYPRVGKSAMRESLSRPFLQQILGRTVPETAEDDMERHTFGIEISSLQLNGKDLFSVWDFAGQIESFITHQFFISTQSTVFTVLINCKDTLEEQRKQLMLWLGFIKMRNLGQVPFTPSQLEIGKETVQMPTMMKEGFGNIFTKVPVVIVGSHYDLISPESREEDISRMQSLVNEMTVKFEDYLVISPRLYPLDCLKSVSPEIRSLREHLCEVRSKLLEVQPVYPRVIELVARKTESLYSDHPDRKVLMWDEIRSLAHEVNKLLSDKQLAFVLKCLTNAGVLVYFEMDALSNYIFIDPKWLCKDVLGKALAPESFPVSQIASVGSVTIPEETLRATFANHHVDEKHVSVIIDLLQHFGLCYRIRGTNNVFEFPTYLKDPLDKSMWQPDPKFSRYCGRLLVCTDETDTFPPGFFSRLQVLISRAVQQEQVFHFKDCIFIDGAMSSYQCLIEMNSASNSISLIGRTEEKHVRDSIRLLDVSQIQIAALIRNVCPTIFLELKIPSSSDLKRHDPPTYYSIHEIIARKSDAKIVENGDSITDLLFMGDKCYQKEHQGKNTKVAYMPIELILQVQELLNDGEKDWKDLAKAIGLEMYTRLLESRAPESTRLLLLKWAEKPRWTVSSLLHALKQIQRLDVYNYVESKF